MIIIIPTPALKRLFLHDITYFTEYYRSVEKIAAGDRREKLLKIGISRALLFYNAAYFLTLYVYQERWPRRVNLIAVNIVYLEHLAPVNCLWMVGFSGIAATLIQTMYYENRSGPAYHLLRWTFVEEKEKTEEGSGVNSSNEKYFKQYFISPSFTSFSRELSVVKVVRKFGLTCRNVMQLIIVSVSKCSVLNKQSKFKVILFLHSSRLRFHIAVYLLRAAQQGGRF